MNSILEQIGYLGILPVAIVEDENKAVPLAQTLSENGLPVIEVTLRTQTAVHVVELITQNFPDMLVGAGTVLTVDDARSAINAGARFIVSPGLSASVVEYCLGKSVPIIPGVLTPTEMQRALDYGLEAVKFFPADAIGGLSYLKAGGAPQRLRNGSLRNVAFRRHDAITAGTGHFEYQLLGHCPPPSVLPPAPRCPPGRSSPCSTRACISSFPGSSPTGLIPR